MALWQGCGYFKIDQLEKVQIHAASDFKSSTIVSRKNIVFRTGLEHSSNTSR